MFDFEHREDEQSEPPSRSILGLEGIRHSESPLIPVAPRPDDEPPGASILRLGRIPSSAVPFAPTPPRLDDEPPHRSLLGLEGIRPAPLPPEAISPAAADGEPPTRLMLGLAGVRPMAPPPSVSAAARRSEEPASRSFFGLEAIRPYSFSTPSVSRPAHPARPAEIEVPDFERDVEHKSERAFPIERAMLASLAAHVLLFLLLLSAPLSVASDPRKGLLAAFVPPEKTEDEKIPIIFREAPGPSRPNPKKSDLSDADRRAAGGDRSKPRSESPFVAERPGKHGLQPGPRRPASPPPAPPPRPAVRQADAGKAAAGQGEGVGKATEQTKPAEEAFIVPRSSPNASGQTPGGRPAPGLEGLNQAIREAAKGVGAQGEDGAGFPNPGGGFVDSGPLSFDTTWYDWGPYAAEMIRRIKLHWEIPSLARFGWKGKVTVRFFILADGRVEGARILSQSGVPPFDFAAFQAIVTSSPFRPLPKDLHEDREGITVTFFYNIRPGEEGGSGATH